MGMGFTGPASVEEGFAEVLTTLMAGEVGAEEAVQRWAALCCGRAAGLREEAGGQLQRAARYMHLRDEARPWAASSPLKTRRSHHTLDHRVCKTAEFTIMGVDATRHKHTLCRY